MALIGLPAQRALADAPSTAYIFPAGGQRGTTVDVRVGGYNLHDSAAFFLSGDGVTAPKRIRRGKTLFFEGPVIPQPASQRKEDYPKDYPAKLSIAANAEPGVRRWRVATSQGVSASRVFVVGELPEVVEREIDGAPIPVSVKLPVTINGRIFPREDVDVWTFTATKGQTIVCEVNAARIGSPLDSRLEVRDARGRRIAENIDALGVDSRLTFTAPETGRYSVHIHDVNFGGLQSYVYRLTISAGPHVESVFPLGGRRGSSVRFQFRGANLSAKPQTMRLPKRDAPFHIHRIKSSQGVSNPVRIELSDLPEHVERPNHNTGPIAVPAVLNGRILHPGEVDAWTFNGAKGETLELDLKAARLGSRLDSVLTIVDSAGKQLATSDDMGRGQTDSQLRFKVPKDGVYTVQVADRLPTRGGPAFAYRLAITRPASTGGFRLTLPADALSVNRGQSAKLKLGVERLGGFRGEIDLSFPGLPRGVTVTGAKIGKNKRNAQLTFQAAEGAKIGVSWMRVKGTATINDQPFSVIAETADDVPQRELWLAVAVPTPFKFTGIFETKYGARGSVFTRHYTIDRGGYKGPLTVRLADIQARHLQGVTGPTIELPPGATEFDYPITMPPWMEIGRTSRTCLMLVGTVTDADGTQHRVSYSSQAQNDQIIVLVDPARLSVRSAKKSIRAAAGKTIAVPVEVARGNGLRGPIQVAIDIPAHIKGVTATPVTIPTGEDRGTIKFKFNSAASRFNMPLTIRVTLVDSASKKPYHAETPLVVVGD